MANVSVPTAVQFVVTGTPRTKGSLRPVHRFRPDGRCNVALIEQGGFELAHWRTLVATAAKRAMGDRHPLDGPLRVTLHFYLPRPLKQDVAHAASDYCWTYNRNDLDKLIRCCLDAGTDAALWHDDAQVAALESSKRYFDTLHPLGAAVVVEALL